ncbi:MAG: methylenetetrahydrofolate reductase C-terminal domain-containing protein [Desulfobulbaceae bacterium]|nr:methylenetetrahydrofolate reductase C-terminal domain-containing protein [Desulfobulbaceae bacterium]
MRKTFQDILTGSNVDFPIGAEVVAMRGFPLSPDDGKPTASLNLAMRLLADERISWVSLTDNPGGNPMLPPDAMAMLLNDEYHDNVVLHLTCKDMNRASIESALWRNAAAGTNNILALSGDLPMVGNPKRPTGVFDLDSTSLLALISAMNAGLELPGRGDTMERLPRCSFFAGCTVNPFKRHESELVPQYYKLLRKIGAGAKWVLPQLGYDMRKFAEVQRFMRENACDQPLIGNVYVLNRVVARMFNQGKLPGCAVADALYEQIEKYAAGPDKGKQFFQELAAKQLAVFKGLGFAAGYLGGLARPEGFFAIIELADSFAKDDWREFYKEIQFSFPDEFFYFGEPDDAVPSPDDKQERDHITLLYRISRLVHATAFRKGRGLHPLIVRLVRLFDKENLFCQFLGSACHMIEKDSKHILYGCSDCGDCGLPDTAYLCPMNSCSKNMRNGPCGGSLHGRCEAGDKDCIWAAAYDRLKHFHELDELRDRPLITYDASLKRTSAWKNFYLERDHTKCPGV